MTEMLNDEDDNLGSTERERERDPNLIAPTHPEKRDVTKKASKSLNDSQHQKRGPKLLNDEQGICQIDGFSRLDEGWRDKRDINRYMKTEDGRRGVNGKTLDLM